MANKEFGVYLLGGASAPEACDHCVQGRCCIARIKTAKRQGVTVSKKLQGNKLQVEQEWVLFGQKTHSRLMCGNISCSALPSHDVAVLLWVLLTFIQSFRKASNDEIFSSSLGRHCSVL